MLICGFEIRIGNWLFRRAESITVTSGWRLLGDKATVVLPMRDEFLYPKQKGALGIKPGQAVEIKMGYNGNLVTEFSGYVVRVDPNKNLTIECQDGFYKLKQVAVAKSFRGEEGQWEQIVAYIEEQAKVKVVTNITGATFGNWRLDYNAASVFEALQNRGIYSYFRGNTLYSGLAYDSPEKGRKVSYRVGENIMSSSLKYRDAESVKLRVYALAVQKDGSTALEAYAGDPEGEQVKLYYYGISSKAELEKLADLELKKYKYTGYEGSLHAWATPNVRHGDEVVLVDPYTPGTEGRYHVDQVITKATPVSIERDVYLGIRLDTSNG